MAKRNDDLRRWAIVGAEQRLLEIAAEAAAIHRQFPGLRQTGAGGVQIGRGRAQDARGEGGALKPRPRRRKMSAEARKRIGDAQRARWAKQKAGKKR